MEADVQVQIMTQVQMWLTVHPLTILDTWPTEMASIGPPKLGEEEEEEEEEEGEEEEEEESYGEKLPKRGREENPLMLQQLREVTNRVNVMETKLAKKRPLRGLDALRKELKQDIATATKELSASLEAQRLALEEEKEKRKTKDKKRKAEQEAEKQEREAERREAEAEKEAMKKEREVEQEAKKEEAKKSREIERKAKEAEKKAKETEERAKEEELEIAKEHEKEKEKKEKREKREKEEKDKEEKKEKEREKEFLKGLSDSVEYLKEQVSNLMALQEWVPVRDRDDFGNRRGGRDLIRRRGGDDFYGSRLSVISRGGF